MTDDQIPDELEANGSDVDKENDESWLLGPDEWPTTVEAAVAAALAAMSDKAKESQRAMARNDLILMHFGLAQWIRNAFGLWRGNEALLMATGRYFDADGSSMVIVERVWEALQERP